MILNIGFNNCVFQEDILFILDAETVEDSEDNIKFIKKHMLNTSYIKDKKVKAYIVTNEDRQIKVYPSYIYSINLLKSKEGIK